MIHDAFLKVGLYQYTNISSVTVTSFSPPLYAVIYGIIRSIIAEWSKSFAQRDLPSFVRVPRYGLIEDDSVQSFQVRISTNLSVSGELVARSRSRICCQRVGQRVSE